MEASIWSQWNAQQLCDRLELEQVTLEIEKDDETGWKEHVRKEWAVEPETVI